jgi:lysyl-tRNA synthetase class II
MLKRVSGKLSFGQLMDQSEEIQLMWEHEHSTLLTDAGFDTKKAEALLGESKKCFDYWFVDKMLDVGDWI